MTLAPTPTARAALSVAGGVGSRRLSNRILPWILMAPALAVLGTLLLWPIVQVVIFSFQDYGLREINTGETNWIGFENYTTALTSDTLWHYVLPNTVGFAVLAVAGTVAFGTAVAVLMMNLSPLWRGIVGSAIMVAWAMPAVTGTYVWAWIFDADRGIWNSMLLALGLIDDPVNWFTNRYSFFGIVLLNVVHHGFPFVAVTVLAGLMSVPKDMLEAAEMDGAGAWRRFFSIMVPNLRQVFTVVIVLSTIWDFKVFTQVFLLPGGDGVNDQVLNLGVWSYQESFGASNYGYGSAIAVLLTVLLLVISVVYVRTLMNEEEL